VVADVEHLPFEDQSFDLVLVHDGLHHLERPQAGLAEMARVARRWVSVTEPAAAAATRLAVRAGVALDREEAGNRVERLSPRDVVAALVGHGFRPLAAQRYAMYYRHEPGAVFGVLSGRWIFPVVRSAWRAGNAIIGRVGNKMVVVATRPAAGEPGAHG
jgi:SAM-dependent methyltransferase